MSILKPHRKLVSFLLSICLIFSSFSTAAFGASAQSDIKGHWAESQITSWIDQGFVKGFPDGSFKPNKNITRAEFVSLANHSFGLSEKADIAFTDLKAKDWSYPEVQIAVKAGYITGYQNNTFRPSNEITREEIASAIAKLLKLNTANATASSFKDDASIAAWSKAAINAVVADKIMTASSANNFRPTSPTTRAEAIVALDRALKLRVTTFAAAGTYGPATGSQVINGTVEIAVSGVTLQNTVVNGDLLLGEGIGEGDATLKNVTVKGKTIVNGGGANSIHFEDSILLTIVIDKANGTVRIVAEGSTTVATVVVQTPATIEESNVTGTGIKAVQLTDLLPKDSLVTLKGSFESLTVSGASIKIDIPVGSVDKVTTESTATGTSLNLGKDAKILNLVLGAVAKLLGTGTIENATVSDAAKGTTFETQPNKVTDSSGTTTPPVSGGGGGGGGGSGDTTAPSIPTGLAATDITENEFTLTWNASTDNVGVTGYQVFIGTEYITTLSVRSITFSELTADTTYVMSVKAKDAAGNISAAATLNVKTAPHKPLISDDAALTVDSAGLRLDFSIDKQIDLGADSANIVIKYFTKIGNVLTPISNTKAGNAPLVKDKTWDGYLSGVDNGVRYSKGSEAIEENIDVIPANTKLATLVKQGYHGVGGDMDYVNIDWTLPATYVAQIIVTDNAGHVSAMKEVQVTVADTTGPTINDDATLSVLSEGGLLLNFSFDKAIDLSSTSSANVVIKYFTKNGNTLTPISNSKDHDSPLVKDKTWDGYLYGVDDGVSYSKGTANVSSFENAISANTKLATLVKRGFHENGDMDYVNIDWTQPATYVVQIIVTDNAGNISAMREVEVTVTPITV